MKLDNSTKERIADITKHIKTYAEQCKDISVLTKQLLRCDDTDGFQWNPENNENWLPLEFSSWSESQLLGKLKIPGAYVHRCPDELQAQNVNYWLNHKPDRELLLRILENEVTHCRAVLSKYTKLDDTDLFPIVFEALLKDADPDLIHVKTFEKTNNFTLLRIIWRDIYTELDGRHYWAGMNIVNSETGLSAIWVKPVVRSATEGVGGYDFIDRSKEGSTRLLHKGQVDINDVIAGIQLAKEAAEVGIAQLMQASKEFVKNPFEVIETHFKESDFLPASTLSVLEEQYKGQVEASKLQIAQDILNAVKELPLFQRYLAEAEVGRFLDLFSATQERAKAIAEAA